MPPINKLPYLSPLSVSRLFQAFRVDEIIALYEALLSEEKTLLVVCREKYDLFSTIWPLISLMLPFEWCLSTIPFILSNPESPDRNLLEFINSLQAVILGIHESAFEEIKYMIEE